MPWPRVSRLAEALGGQTELDSDYSAWPYRPECATASRILRAGTAKKPRIAALHAGLSAASSPESPELDCISSALTTDIHTPRERLHIAST